MKRKVGEGDQDPLQDRSRGGGKPRRNQSTTTETGSTGSTNTQKQNNNNNNHNNNNDNDNDNNTLIREKTKRAAPRQDPVSCQSCRTRKLKCDRQNPCSNCESRHINCVYLARVNAAHAATNNQPGYYDSPSSTRVALEDDSHPVATSLSSISASQSADLGLREKLPHDLTREQAERVLQPVTSHSVSSLPLSARDQSQLDERNSTLDRLEKLVMGPRPPNAGPGAATATDNFGASFPPRQGAGSGGGSGNSWSRAMWSDGAYSYGDHGWQSQPQAAALTSGLPRESEAVAMFEHYVNNIDHIYHLVLPSRVRRMIDGIYADLHSNAPVNLNHLAFLFSILAVTSYFQPLCSSTEDGSNPPILNQEEEERRAEEYTSMVGAALMKADYLGYPTLEALQATILIAHLMPNIPTGSSIRAFFLHSTIVNQAKHMMLHCIDSPRYDEERRTCGNDLVTLEIKRRVWWHIVGYDWLLSFLGGPQEQTYLIHPNHMCVDIPLNIEDDQLVASSEPPKSLPLSVPTSQTYSIIRLKLANLTRELTDGFSAVHFQGSSLPYDVILALDKKVQALDKEIPPFLRVDPANRKQYAALYRQRPSLAWQRLMAQQGYHVRTLRLHRHYFLRGVKDPRYSYSYVMCVQAAQRVLEIKRIMDEEEPVFSPPSSTVWTVMHHSFISAVVLLMDVCFNWDDILADQKRNEVLEACRRLTLPRRSTCTVREGIREMMKILQKYWMSEPRPPAAAAAVMSAMDSARNGNNANQMQITSSAASSSDIISGRDRHHHHRNPDPDPARLHPYRPADDGDVFRFHEGDNCQPSRETTMFTSSNVNPQLSITDGTNNWELESFWTQFLENGAGISVNPEDWSDIFTELTNVKVT